MAEPLSPRYDPHAIEDRLYRRWEERGYFRADPDAVLRGEKQSYVIVIPPPNVTAVLHMGHGLNNTLQDVLIRAARMRGYEALWMPGTDHAGIATQNVVERMLAEEGKSRHDLGREEFVERVWAFVRATGSTILEQLRAIGCSCDWTRTRFTLEPDLSRAVREVFVRLHEKGLIYRGNYIINWCPRCLTALSDEEAEPAETQGKLYFLRYPFASGDWLGPHGEGSELPRLPDGRPYVMVATTRPETMLGDTAVAVHPEDERYRELIGAELDLPLTGRRIPVIADAFVDPEFGTGAVKATPAHDTNDFELGRRHGLPVIDVLTPEATMSANAPPAFQGLDRFEARERVVQAFRELGLLDRIEDHLHSIPHCYRCDTIVEPRVSEQWFVRMKPLAEPALAASREGRVTFAPERWTRVYEHWLENIRDWCISRQLWWGHRIPVWYCRREGCEGETIVAREDPTSCPRCGSTAELVQDPDVLDTWFSSWLWPFSTMGWPEETKDLEAFYPTATLNTAPEILFFWVARMIMAGIEFRGQEPFHSVYLHGTVRDRLGRKMSKSLGNGIDPLEVKALYGADALRWTAVSLAGIGVDLFLDPTNLEDTFSPGRDVANKVWNVGRFALMNLEGGDVVRVDAVRERLELPDRWILSRLNAAAAEVTQNLDGFRFQRAAAALRRFFWDELADWYLEVVKPRLYDDAAMESRVAARAALVEALDGALRLMHPIVPFITEELWQRLPRPLGVEWEESLVVADWPEPRAERSDPEAESAMAALIELVGAVRSLRSEYNVPVAQELEVRLSRVPAGLRTALEVEERALRRLARVGSVVYVDGADGGGKAGAHAVLSSGAELFLPLGGIIDIARERTRLGEELDRLEGLLRGTEARLSNEQFVARAPADVVAREREKAESLRDQRERLSRKLAALTE